MDYDARVVLILICLVDIMLSFTVHTHISLRELVIILRNSKNLMAGVALLPLIVTEVLIISISNTRFRKVDFPTPVFPQAIV
jgi:hypothetical protein